MTTIRPRRSALYLPASNARAIAKARTLPADIVILDLEDAVAPDMKEAARAAAVDAAQEGGFGMRELIVRVNGAGSAWGEDDLATVAHARFDGVLLPKVDGPDDIAAARAILGDRPIWAMIETCAALPRLDGIAAAEGLEGFVLGLNDLALEMRARPGPDRAPFLPVMTLAVAAARAHGRAVLDGVCNAIGERDRFEGECAQAVAWGFDGKSLIHPDQIAPCNAAFAPTAEALAWARLIVEAFAAPENAGKGALRIDGRMVERLHRDEALRLIQSNDVIASRDPAAA